MAVVEVIEPAEKPEVLFCSKMEIINKTETLH
jgi:hypothetical protein